MKLPTLGIERVPPVGAVPSHQQERFEKFAMTPWSAVVDKRLKSIDLRVYAVLAACRKGSTVELGVRLIARYIHAGHSRVGDALQRLKEFGYVEMQTRENGRRAEYRLTYGRFAVEAPDAKAKVSVEEKPKREQVDCPKCRKRVGGLTKTGWCRSCNHELKTRRLVREEIAKLA